MKAIFKSNWAPALLVGVLLVGLFFGLDPLVQQGTTNFSSLTLGEGVAADSAITYDGNAQDFYIALDDSADDLLVGYGSTVGTTPAFAIDEDLVTTWSGGTLELAETVAATNALTAAECGKTMFLNHATEFATTLPAISTVSAGCSFRFIVAAAPSGANYTIVTGNSLENVLTGGINELETDSTEDGPYQADGDTITFASGVSVTGDWVYMISDGSDFYFTGQAQADGGVTPSQAD